MGVIESVQDMGDGTIKAIVVERYEMILSRKDVVEPVGEREVVSAPKMEAATKNSYDWAKYDEAVVTVDGGEPPGPKPVVDVVAEEPIEPKSVAGAGSGEPSGPTPK